MKKRNQRASYKYGKLLNSASQIFRFDLYERINLEKTFASKKVLDVGCGFGIDSLNLLRYARKVIGSDIDFHDTWEDYKSKNLSFVQSKSENLPFRKGSFEAVFLKDLLHHVEDPDIVLEEIKRVTKKGGSIVIVEGNRYNPLFFMYATLIKGHNHFSQHEFEKMVRKHYKHVRFKRIECYPPFSLNVMFFKYVPFIEKQVERFSFLNRFFSYNIAIIKRS